jgi:death-on-curing protein
MQYLSERQLLLIHSIVVDETGGSHGVREYGAIKSVIAVPQQITFGQELYSTIFDKSATYARNIIMNHPFIDGNKRTGMTAAVVFLENNGYQFIAKQGQVERLAVLIISDKLEIDKIADWLRQNTKPKAA